MAPGPEHTDHAHGVAENADGRWLSGALGLVATFMVAEFTVGLIVGSLALLSDSAHMLTDVVSIALALVARRLAAQPPRGGYTFGLKRAEILSAQANGLALLLLAGWLAVASIGRLIHPADVPGLPVLVAALAGIVVNLVVAAMMARANRRSLNIEGAYQHIITDLFAFIATAVAGVIILATGFSRADSIASLIVVVLMVRAGLMLVLRSGRVLLEAAPAGLVPAQIGGAMARQDGVVEVHDLHVWEITSGSPALSAHVIVAPGLDCHALRLRLEALLHDEYDVTHTTLQVDHAEPELHSITHG